MLLSQSHTRQRFDLEVEHRIPLCLSEIADLALHERQIVDDGRGQTRDDLRDLIVG